MNVEIGTETPIFLFWKYLFQILGVLSLQCIAQQAEQAVMPRSLSLKYNASLVGTVPTPKILPTVQSQGFSRQVKSSNGGGGSGLAFEGSLFVPLACYQ